MLKQKINFSIRIPFKEFLYFCLMAAATGLAFVKTIVFGAYLKPEMMGYYSIAITLSGYGTFLQLGLLNGLNRELPVCLGSRNEDRYRALVGETTVAVVGLQVIGVLLYCILLTAFRFEKSGVKEAFYFAGLITISATFDQIVMLRLRAEQRILGFSFLKLINSVAIIGFGIMAIPFLGFKGALIGIGFVQILSFITVSKFFLRTADYFHFQLSDFFYLLRIGFPLMVAGVLANFQMSMDRLFIIRNFPASTIGIYQIGILPLSFGVILSSIICQYLSPKLLYRYGQTSSLKSVYNTALTASFITMGAMALFFPAVPFISSFVINHWLQDYRDSLPIISIFYLGAVFTAGNIVGVVVNAANRQILAFYQGFIITLGTFLCYLVVSRYSMPINFYAYVNVMAQIISFFANIAISYYVRVSQGKFKISVLNFGKLQK